MHEITSDTSGKEFKSIDILVNNAGVSGVNKPTREIPNQDELDKNLHEKIFCLKMSENLF